MPFRYHTLPVTAFHQNCSIVWCDETREAAVIDPGGEIERLLAFVEAEGLALKQIWLTHAHIDHAGGTGQLARERGLPITGPHEGDRFWIDGLPQQSRMFGFPPAETFEPTAGSPMATRSRWAAARCRFATAPATRPATWCSSSRRHAARSWATCSSPAASAAPTSRKVTSTS